MSETTEKEQNTLSKNIYSIYDCVLKQFEPPFCCSENDLQQTMILLVNDPMSKYYGRETDFILNKIAEFSQDTGEIIIKFIERINILNVYIDEKKRQLQTIIQTLNFMPQGYYKMPEDRKKEIQESIDNAIQKYVENYVVPDIDVNSSKIKDLEAQIDKLTKSLEYYKSLSKDKEDLEPIGCAGLAEW